MRWHCLLFPLRRRLGLCRQLLLLCRLPVRSFRLLRRLVDLFLFRRQLSAHFRRPAARRSVLPFL
jgi:hypothetical protein